MATEIPQVHVRLKDISTIDQWADHHGLSRSDAINMMCMTVLDAGGWILVPHSDDPDLPEQVHVRLKAIPLIDEFASRHKRSRSDTINTMCVLYMEAEKEIWKLITGVES